MCLTCSGTAIWMLASATPFGGTNNNCQFRDEAADSGDQFKVPVDPGKEMGFHVVRSGFMSEPITGLIRPSRPALATNSSGLYDAESSHR
jgi:hypothetical protein